MCGFKLSNYQIILESRAAQRHLRIYVGLESHSAALLAKKESNSRAASVISETRQRLASRAALLAKQGSVDPIAAQRHWRNEAEVEEPRSATSEARIT